MGPAEHEEFRAYVAARSSSLLRTAYLITGNRHDAEDLLQTALAKVWLAWARIEDKRAVDAYVRRALVNTHTSRWRRRKLDEYPTADVPEIDVWGGRDDYAARELSDALWLALAQLPRRQRIAVVLRYYEELSEAETAAVLGVSVGTVKSTVSRALGKLRRDAAALGLRDGEPASSSGSVDGADPGNALPDAAT